MDRSLYDYNARANRAMKSPGFAIGELLGGIWSKNYTDRGNAKAIDAALEQYDENSTQTEKDSALAQVEANNKADAYNILGTYDMKAIDNIAEKYGVKTPMGRAMYENSYLNNPNNFNDGSEFSKRRLIEIAKDNQAVAALGTLGYGAPQRQEAVQNALNANALAQQNANARMSNFNAKEALSNVELDLIKKGYTKEQIATITGTLGDKFQAVQDKQYEQKTQELVSDLVKLSPLHPDYQNTLVKLSKYNPTAANMLYKNVITGKDIWGSGEKKDMMKQSLENSKDLAKNQFDLRKNLLDYTNNQKYGLLTQAGVDPEEARKIVAGFRNGDSKVDTTAFKIASDIAEKAEKKMRDEFGNETGYQLSDMEKQAIAFRNAFAGKLFVGDNKETAKPKINLHDYNQAMLDNP